ncbi:MAG: hypothetical protein OEY22_10335 [Candidatus Bathyarchaeota archaeon]|nr:hypothetical protein [Candidatus Bathyarchaeota archaeon]MDH5788812.1 hypothetical protein [Candidatus Bathyarchaeota archaeon]
MDEILEMLEKTTKRMQKDLDENQHWALKQIENYDGILKSKASSEAQKVRALLGKTLEYDRLERLSSQLSILYILQMFAFKVKVLKISIDSIKEQLAQSEILEKAKGIEDVEKKIDRLMILLETQYESMTKIEEDRKKDVSYVS